MTTIMRHKSVALTFRGFEVDPAQVEEMIGFKASEIGTRGAPVKPGVKTILKRSFARFSIDVEENCRLDEMIPKLFLYLGGVEKIESVRERISPEFFELDITLPVKYSDDQEGGFIPASVISDLFHLRCNLSFGFV